NQITHGAVCRFCACSPIAVVLLHSKPMAQSMRGQPLAWRLSPQLTKRVKLLGVLLQIAEGWSPLRAEVERLALQRKRSQLPSAAASNPITRSPYRYEATKLRAAR